MQFQSCFSMDNRYEDKVRIHAVVRISYTTQVAVPSFRRFCNMALYAIGDLHLSFQSEIPSIAQKNSPLWKNHEQLFRRYCTETIQPEDTLVLVGDHSWGKKLAFCEKDLQYIEALPGRKILIRGNHDMFWPANKTKQLNTCYEGRLHFLQDNFFSYKDYALVGTKGITFEGPFYVDRRGNILGWDPDAEAQAQKLARRELKRLRDSFEQAASAGYRKFLMFLHYPPTNILESESCFTRIAEEYGVEQVVYAHCHGEERFHDSIIGIKNGIRYSLVSGDYLRWRPQLIKA